MTTAILIFLAVCYLVSGCVVSAVTFVEEWRGRDKSSVQQTVLVAGQMLLVALFWPFVVAAFFVYVAVSP